MKKSKDISFPAFLFCIFFAALNAWIWSREYEAESVIFTIVLLLSAIAFRQMKQMGI